MNVMVRILKTTLVVMFGLVLSSTSLAITITVTNPGDTIALADGVTLREAITAANTNAISGDAPAGSPGVDTIAFAIPGAGVQTIMPATPLPQIIEPLIIDGYTQPLATANTLATGTNANLLIEIDGSAAGVGAIGLDLVMGADNSTIRGLIINNFATAGISVGGAIGSNTIVGNFIGINAMGNAAAPNGAGIILNNANNVVGTMALADRNLISGNSGMGTGGIVITSAAATGNTIANNLIGTDRTGTMAVPNLNGISIALASSNVIGGFLAGQGNLIAFNTNDGIVHSAGGAGNSFLRNSIHSNGGLGIDLNDDGVTANDAAPDADVGPNDLQNFPVLTATTANTSGTRIAGTLASTPSSTFRIEFFTNTAADGSGNGEGETYFGSREVTTDAMGNATFEFTSPTQLALGTIISATATAPSGSTSEFSENSEVVAGPRVDETPDDDDGDDDDFIPIPVPPLPLPPVPPVPPVAGPVAPAPEPVPVATAVPVVDVAADKEESDKVNAEASDVLSDEITINTEDEQPKKRKKKKAKQESGCATTQTDASMIGFLGLVAMALRVLSHRRRSVRARS